MSRFLLSILALWVVNSMTLAGDKRLPYPESPKEDVVEKLHGVKITDPYRWLEEANSPKVKTWTDLQNQLTQKVLGDLPGRKAIHNRLETLLNIGSLGTPRPVKGKYFYSKREGDQNQPVLYVREGLDGKDRVLIDPNALAKDGTIALDWWYTSHDGKLLVYGTSKNGTERSTLRILEVETGKHRPDVIEQTRACSVAWLPDDSGFYYTRYPKVGTVPKGEDNYYRWVYFHKLGADPEEDELVFGKGRPKEDWPSVSLSPDGRWLVVSEHQGWAKNEVYFRDTKKADSNFVPLVEGVTALFEVIVRNDRFLIHTNHEAPRYRVMQADPTAPARKEWKELVPQSGDVLEGVAAVGDNLVLEYMHKASSLLKLHDKQGKHVSDISLPTIGTVTGLGSEWDGDEFLFGFNSFTVPSSVYRVDLKTKKTSQWARVKADIDFDDYVVEQVTYPSKDKTPITMFLAYKKGLKKDGSNPTLLYGYGGFNISITPSFRASRFLFLENGGLLAVANLRGGGEYGEDWHQAGMLGNKQNVFDDFISGAEWLIDKKYTTKKKLAIEGGSNGGLLVGAALTQRPDLFEAVVCRVPLLDMIRYHKFLIARLWIPEYGSADDPKQFEWIRAYSPYHRVKEGQAYPATLLATAASDTRVDALHARKMAAMLQNASSSDEPILLRLETNAGHGAGKPRGKVVEELTDIYGFVFWQLKMKPKGS